MGNCRASLMSSHVLNVNAFLAERLLLLGLDLCVNLGTFGWFIAVIACLHPQTVSHVRIPSELAIMNYDSPKHTGSVGSF